MRSPPSRILIIEDDKDMIEALRIILETGPYEVKVAFNGKQGLEAIQKEKPDLIVLDLLLPGEDGATICRSLKRTPQYENIPILVLTALAQKVENKIFPKKEALHADEYLDKPVSPEDLIGKIERLLKK